jgi:hypothetical protein
MIPESSMLVYLALGSTDIIYIARDMSGMSCKDLGVYFGGVSGALITMMYNRVTKEGSKNGRLKGRIHKIERRILNI